MNIAYDGLVFQFQKHGGISRLYREILPRICDLDPGIAMTVITTGRCRGPIPAHVRIHHRPMFPIDDILRPHRLWRGLWEPAKEAIQKAELRNLDGAIWHSTYYTRPKFWKGPCVTTVLDMIHERFPQYYGGAGQVWFKAQKEHSIRAADRVICISETTKNDVAEYYGLDASKACVIPLAASPVFEKRTPLGSDPSSPNGRPFVLYVGAREGYKNFSDVLGAYVNWNHRADIDLIAVGPPWTAEERKQLGRKGLSDRVHLFDDLDDRSLCGLYNIALALVFPSSYEGFGIPLLEASACGCPVVASRIPTTREVLGENAFYFEAGRVDDLILALDAAARAGRDSKKSMAGIEIAHRYSWERTARLTHGVYLSIG